MSKFDEWWSGETNPALNMPESTQIQIKSFMRAAFNAGKEAWRDKLLPHQRIDIAKEAGKTRIEYATSDGGDVP